MKKKYPKFSIVIPLYVKTPYFFESVEKCLELDYPNFEILIGIDKPLSLDIRNKRIKIFKTTEVRTGPAEKRDICIRKATGEYIAFLDDDSYPAKDWLKKSLTQIRAKKVASVCGPGLTPPADIFAQKITGAILSSPFGSGPYAYRFTKKQPRFVDDYPAYNMVVSKSVLKKIGGFGTKYYGGEDTALCIKIINAGEKIYYHPDIVVYHHRRFFPLEYAKQVGNVGRHRGYFVKAFPQTSLRPSYFLPAVMTIALPLIALLLILDSPLRIYASMAFALYYFAVFLEALQREGLLLSAILPFAVIASHAFYGEKFLRGLFLTENLVR
jgi:glycosyltransferase involved in cell wall biosynthesis